MMEIITQAHNKVIVGTNDTGFITSETVESNLLFAILEKLEEIRCGLIDIESVVNPR